VRLGGLIRDARLFEERNCCIKFRSRGVNVPLRDHNARMAGQSLNREGIGATFPEASAEGVTSGVQNASCRQLQLLPNSQERVGQPIASDSYRLADGEDVRCGGRGLKIFQDPLGSLRQWYLPAGFRLI